MVGQALWKNLKNLVTIDKQLTDLDEKIKQAEKIIKKDQQIIPDLESKLEKEKKEYLQARKNFDYQELIAKELKDKDKAKRELLDNTSNQKEFAAIEKELKSISHQINEQDDLLMKNWHQLEEIKNKYDQNQKNKDEKVKQVQEGIEVQLGSLKDLEAQRNKILEEKEEAQKNVPPEWLSKYERMKNKVPDPIVPVLGTTCSVCFYSILRQDLSILKKAGVLPCRNCYRFLYCEEQEEKDAKSENF